MGGRVGHRLFFKFYLKLVTSIVMSFFCLLRLCLIL